MDHLEQWQIVLYTISLMLFVQWIRKVSKFEEFVSIRHLVSRFAYELIIEIQWHDILLSFASYKAKLEENKEIAYKELEGSFFHRKFLILPLDHKSYQNQPQKYQKS